MSSTSKSSSSTSTKTSTTDARVGADNGGIATRSGNVTVLDGGAIKLADTASQNAFDTAQGIADLSAQFAFDALGFVTKNNASTAAIIKQVVDQQQNQSTQIAAQLIRIGIPAVAMILIIRGWKT